MKPVVAIVGRPNVGKSTLFNRLVGKRAAIVDETPGVTRDRHYAEAEWGGYQFILVDTGGLVIGGADLFEPEIREQTEQVLKEADLIIFLMDGAEGLTKQDEEIGRLLRRTSRPIVWAVNKSDQKKSSCHEFYALGIGEPILISSEHGIAINELLDAVIGHLPMEEARETEPEAGPHPTRIAVIGRPNVGKSTLINSLAGTERVVVHEIAGTTRDTIDVEIDYKDRAYLFIDTAGIKRRAKTLKKLDKITTLKSLKMVERAEVVLLMVDVQEGITHQDQELLKFIQEEYKPVILLGNKWDLVEAKQKEFITHLRNELRQLRSLPILCISAQKGMGINKIFPSVDRLQVGVAKRFTTSELNRILEVIVEEHHIPAYQNKEVKIYYATQVSESPPKIIAFANYPQGIPTSYRRYLLNRLQELYGEGIPIKIIFKERSKKE